MAHGLDSINSSATAPLEHSVQNSIDVPHRPRRELRPPLPYFRLEVANEAPDVARSDFGQEYLAELERSVMLQTRLIVAGTGNLPKAPVLNPARQVASDGNLGRQKNERTCQVSRAIFVWIDGSSRIGRSP